VLDVRRCCEVAVSLTLPGALRLLPRGHETGKPHQPDLRRRIVRDAMRAFETIARPGEIVELPHVWDPNNRAWGRGALQTSPISRGA